MKDFLEEKYGLDEKVTFDRLRSRVGETWDKIEGTYLRELVDSMPSRMRAVVDANGMHTRF